MSRLETIHARDTMVADACVVCSGKGVPRPCECARPSVRKKLAEFTSHVWIHTFSGCHQPSMAFLSFFLLHFGLCFGSKVSLDPGQF